MTSLTRPLARACAGTILTSRIAAAKTTPAPHKQLETIGQPQSQMMPLPNDPDARSATLDGTTINISGTAGSAIVLADRRFSAAGHSPTSAVISEGDEGSDGFAAHPPCATISVFDEGGASIGPVRGYPPCY